MIEPNEDIVNYFPYAKVRPCQDEFVNAIFEAVEERRSILIEGSNGLGKTLQLCSARAMGKKLKILYVARTHRQHDRVIEELKEISKKRPVSGLSVRSRHEMCLNSLKTNHALNAREAIEACELLKARGNCSSRALLKINPT